MAGAGGSNCHAWSAVMGSLDPIASWPGRREAGNPAPWSSIGLGGLDGSSRIALARPEANSEWQVANGE
jgi:hypothetical protein